MSEPPSARGSGQRPSAQPHRRPLFLLPSPLSPSLPSKGLSPPLPPSSPLHLPPHTCQASHPHPHAQGASGHDKPPALVEASAHIHGRRGPDARGASGGGPS